MYKSRERSQVGNELFRMDLILKGPSPTLGLCVASTGDILVMIQQSLQNKLRDMHIDREVVTIISQVIVKNNTSILNHPNMLVKGILKKQKNFLKFDGP